MKKRILSILLICCMVLTMLPATALAEESGQTGGGVTASGLCEHHPAHDDECGYTEGTAGTPCSHEHTDDCYTEVTDCVHEHTEDCYPQNSVSGNNATSSNADEPTECTHVCSEESGCITKQLNCQHEHDEDCGYTPATAGTPCGYVCEICGAEGNAAEAMTVERVQAMIDALPDAEEITEDNAEEVTAQLEAIDEAKAELTDEEIDELDITRYMAAAAALGSLAAPMLLANAAPAEQFNLTPGGTYWFDLSGENIPGTVNTGTSFGAVSVPDTTLHYVPFTYAGTVDAYKLTSEMVTTEDYATQNKYPHSLFVADYAVTHTVSWDELNNAGLIFGKSYTGGSVDYTLRAPSAGSWHTGSYDLGTPQSNEWDAVLDKNSGYIKNWNGMFSWGQDTSSSSYSATCAERGYYSARYWYHYYATTYRAVNVGFCPVLEVLHTYTLGSDGLKAVTLDLNGGKLGGSTDTIQIIVKNGAAFTAPASDGLTAPQVGYSAQWQDSDGNLYAPGDSVPADVTTLTAQWTPAEQFNLTPGGTYWFDLSGENIPGTVNTGNSDGAASVPDTTLHYVPFTYAGTVDAYKLTSEMQTTEDYAEQNKYPHSLFVSDYAVTHTVRWYTLNIASLIFGKSYTGGSVDYTLRAPSGGSWQTGSNDRGTPQSNEWDAVLDKNSGYIKNWNGIDSWGQDSDSIWGGGNRVTRGWNSARFWSLGDTSLKSANVGFRPVLEVLNTDALGPDGLKAVTLDLNGGKLGGSTDNIQIIVKNGAAFTAPASDGLTRPDGDTGDYFKWLGSDGNLYAPGDSVPAGVTTLTAQWTDTYTVTLHLNDGTIANGKDVTEYTYGTGATLPTADDITRDGHTFEGWYEDENFSGSPVTEISATDTGKKEFYAKWTLNTYTVTFDSQGGSKVDSQAVSHGGTVTEPTAPTYEGYTFGGWYTEAGCTTEYDFTTTVTESLTLYAKWKDVTCPTGEITVDKSKWNTFFNNITFGLFFKDTQKVTITASDNSGDNVTITYLLSDKELTVDELNASVFTAYTGAFYIEPNNEYVIYAKLTDSSGNICYINSNGVVLDNVDPLISGIIDGKTYCEAQTVTIDEKYVDSVTVDGTAVTLTDGKFTLSPADGKQTIVVTDKAGNKAEMTVTVNDGHTGGTATCTEKAKCEVCGTAYGEINANNHTDLKHIKAKAATKNAEGNIEYWYCEDCGKYFSDADAKNEITKAATVIAKLTDDTKSPQTGDNSHMVLWFALLFVSCGGIITTIYIGKRKKKKSE